LDGLKNNRFELLFLTFTMSLRTKMVYLAGILVFAAICYFPLFYKLDVNSIKVWDESRYACNAIEMLENGNLIVVKFNGEPDYWNTKPPMVVWMQVIAMKVLGINVLAVRLPSALAAIFTIILIILFSVYVLKKPMIGFLASLALITSKGYVAYHVTRTGDTDAVLTFFTTLYALSFFTFLLKFPESFNKYVVLSVLAFVFAVLTKGIAGIIPATGLFFYAMTQKSFYAALRNYRLYCIAGAGIVLIFLYYFLRQKMDHVYINAVLQNDFGFYVNDFHKKEPFSYYFDTIILHSFKPFAIYVLFGILVGLLQKDLTLRKFTLFSLLYGVCFLLVHSFSTNKNSWYDAPVYPVLAFLFAILVDNFVTGFIFSYLKSDQKWTKNIIWLILVLAVFYAPYLEILKSIKPEKTPYLLEKESYVIHKMAKSDIDFTNCVIDRSNTEWIDPLIFTIKAYPEQNLSLRNNSDFYKGELLLTCNQPVKDSIKACYSYQIVYQEGECCVFKILDKQDSKNRVDSVLTQVKN
jgi:4-amino-4-deoxy-L-arabinose transferase-like glycosyltransferase